jgi:hypothetical protein
LAAVRRFRPPSEAAREQRVRRSLKRIGYRLHKSRCRLGSIDNFGGYRIIDSDTNFVVLGVRYELTLDDVERWVVS